jgi:uncharacterized protein YwgA
MHINSQSYQEVSKEVKKEVLLVTGGKGKWLPRKFDVQKHFYDLKQKEPERFARLHFNENGQAPFSSELSSIILEMKMSGFLTDISL